MVTFENAVLVAIAIVVIWAVCSLRDKFKSRIEQLTNEVSIYRSFDDENRDLRACNAALEVENNFLKERVAAFESVDEDTKFIRYMGKYFIIALVDYHCDKSSDPSELDTIDISAIEINKDGVVHG